MFYKDANKPIRNNHIVIFVRWAWKVEKKMRINNHRNPEEGLADTEANGGLGTQDQVQLPASQVQKKETVK